MKVTALIDDDLIAEVKRIAKAKNITQGLVTALKYYVDRHKIDEVIAQVEQEPFQFRDGFTAYGKRDANRDR